ncbi:cation transporter [Candidatus Woesearchaeota archaeon]|nr:cation transporter [Candidatus Woesearchaeota archaeon]
MNKGKVSVIAVAANLVLAISKISIGLISKSSAVLAEGLHSSVDILSSMLSFLGIRAAKKPADKEHPYGHHKFEVLSGLAITIILFLTGAWIIYRSYNGFINPSLTEINYLALGVMAFSATINEIMARIKLHYGRKEHSLSLISDGIHSRIDVISSLVIFAGLFLTPIFKYSDPLLTFLIGAYILKESFSLGKEATDSLLDVSAGEEIEKKIRDIIHGQKIELSELKTQKKGSVITANMIIKLERSLSIGQANAISSGLQKRLTEEIPNLQYISVQMSSHDLESNYYQPTKIIPGIKIVQGFGWQRKGKFIEKIPEAKGRGPGGKCICNKCRYETGHKQGVPCSTIKCPKCKNPMTRG